MHSGRRNVKQHRGEAGHAETCSRHRLCCHLGVIFFGTLFLLDSFDALPFDQVRVAHARSLTAALEKYRAAHGRYPDSEFDLAALRAPLIGDGFIAQLKVDPY